MGNNNLRNALILMRIPFSIYLMPVYWFALSRTGIMPVFNAVLIFIILHLFVYPASNGFNSLYDRDTTSIGGLREPPPVNDALKWLVWGFDIIAVLLSLLVSGMFSIMILIYLLISKAYSYDRIRIKKYPFLSAAVVSFFQGGFIFLAVCTGMGNLDKSHLLPAIVSSLFLLGSYPLTQVYQHEADRLNGDTTLSMIVGIMGTFVFSGIVFALAGSLLIADLWRNQMQAEISVFMVAMIPVMIVFSRWMRDVYRHPAKADFDNTMRMNKISSLSLSAAFIIMLLLIL